MDPTPVRRIPVYGSSATTGPAVRWPGVGLKKPVRPATISPRHRTESPLVEKDLRPFGVLVVVVGLLVLSLAAGDALADAEVGLRGDDALRGSDLDDRLAGFGEKIGSLASPAKIGSPAAVATRSSTVARAATHCSAVRGRLLRDQGWREGLRGLRSCRRRGKRCHGGLHHAYLWDYLRGLIRRRPLQPTFGRDSVLPRSGNEPPAHEERAQGKGYEAAQDQPSAEEWFVSGQ